MDGAAGAFVETFAVLHFTITSFCKLHLSLCVCIRTHTHRRVCILCNVCVSFFLIIKCSLNYFILPMQCNCLPIRSPLETPQHTSPHVFARHLCAVCCPSTEINENFLMARHLNERGLHSILRTNVCVCCKYVL